MHSSAAHPAPPWISIVIPLEFGHGQELECLTRWLAGQDFPPERYEVVVVGSQASLTQAQVAQFQAMLRPQDSLHLRPERHDVPLSDYGARQARGEWVVITEAHVLPRADTLRLVERAVAERPGMAAFSASVEPLVHNPLSAAEAAMYGPHIQSDLEGDSWRKVSTQFYASRRAVFLEAGGLPADYGSFAAVVLAARMRTLGHAIEHVPSVGALHHYGGTLGFTRGVAGSYTQGKMRYLADAGHEPAHALVAAEEARPASAHKPRFKWASAARAWWWSRLTPARWRRIRAGWRLQWAISRPDADGRHLAALTAWNGAVAHEARLDFLAQASSKQRPTR